MAGSAKPNVPNLGDEGKIEIIDAYNIAYIDKQYGGKEDVATLFDGIVTKQGGYNAVILRQDSYIEFSTVNKLCNIWTNSGGYSDSGGSAGKQIKLEKWNGQKYEEVGVYNTTNSSDWYLLLPNLESGKYKIAPTGNYVAFNEWYVEHAIKNKSLIQLSNNEYRKYHAKRIDTTTAIPKMNSNTAPIGRAFARDVWSTGYDAWYGFNQIVDSEGYCSQSGSGGVGYLGYEFSEANLILKYSIRSMSYGDKFDRLPRDWTFEGSNDGQKWDILDAQKNQTWTTVNTDKDYYIINPKAYKMYRLNWTANNGNTGYTVINELKMYSGELGKGWELINNTTLTQQDFDEHGMTELSIIPPEAWQELAQLSPTIEIVTYVPEGNKAKPFTETYMDIPLRIDMTALPIEQLIVQPSDFDLHGNLISIVANKLPAEVNAYDGTCKFIVSFDKGATWEAFKNGKWKTVNAADMVKVREQGMSFKTLAQVNEKHFLDKGKQIRIGYYLDDSIHREEEVKLDNSQLIVKSALDDVKFEDMTFHLLNTTATIHLQLTGNKLTGELDDADKGKVQYRVLLNEKPYYPDNGEFTRLASSPLDINLYISEREILFNQENKLTVEFQDYWGQTDQWETKFIGTYSGLMFMDKTGNYYSDTFGGILKYLDFGIIIAGQTTVDQKVVVKNQLGYEITNLTLEVAKDSLPQGVTIELSRSNKPFIAQDKLLFSQIFQQDDTVEFYVRIATVIEAEPTVNGQFEIRAKADRV
ncbi:hypothetical protein M3650_24680 [Paenibacillus sp. MER TA 81-3]|uniref:hypothetical protein n=1 Tax=Paenibacillus sp. MER TA 81-3 TaxID=2939573 RepID=UPI00203F2789|nr:hypothetical protein [Paenibacillus sp. MER TA 81-3]MCM3341733.1 hypothetical protein [Paenibacillus sp. MER TA 81-3]